MYCFANIYFLELVLAAEAVDNEDELNVTYICSKNTSDISFADQDSGVSVGSFGTESIPIWYSIPNSVLGPL